jgi:glutamate synthase (NADPH) small chain
MGKITGFLEYDRQEPKYQPAGDRIRHSNEFTLPLDPQDVEKQAARCMDCGVPYCHGSTDGSHDTATGCPIHNQIPDWNDLVMKGNWKEALQDLHTTNNFPEFTGRICPAPCEEACTLNLEHSPVAIKTIEQALADKGWEEGWIKPEMAPMTTGKRVAIVGSGPAGLAAAQRLARIGHEVHVYEREAKAGGLLRYGIPDFKMEKHHIDRRVHQMEAEGVIFHYNVNVGAHQSLNDLENTHDVILLTIGAEKPRDPQIKGQELSGVHFAMEYLSQQNRAIALQGTPTEHEKNITHPIHAGGKNVVVMGGGDTASDCIGTAFRQGALSVTQLDIRPLPPQREETLTVWPYWPTRLRISSSQAEGVDIAFETATLEILGHKGRATGVLCAKVDAKRIPISGTEFTIPADIVLIGIGFSGVRHHAWFDQTGLPLNAQSRLHATNTNYLTARARVFAAGDARRGQSLVVWAIREGRQAARAIDVKAFCLNNLCFQS